MRLDPAFLYPYYLLCSSTGFKSCVSFQEFFIDTIYCVVQLVSDCLSGLDLIFVLDGSNSVHVINYQKTLVALKNAALSFLNDYNNSRIGLITYASGIQDIIPPTSSKTVLSASKYLRTIYPARRLTIHHVVHAGIVLETIIKETSSHATPHGTLVHSHLSSLSHCGMRFGLKD